jgi:uridine kinase
VGCPRLALDDFYRNGDEPGLPQTLGIVDWDDAASWDAEAALATLITLCRDGTADVPVYDIATSRRTGWHRLDLGDHRGFVAEGIFAPEMARRCRSAGLAVTAIWLDRPRTATMIMRLARDLREHRKPPGVLVRRGLALWGAEPALRARAVVAGCRPLAMRSALTIVRALTRPT